MRVLTFFLFIGISLYMGCSYHQYPQTSSLLFPTSPHQNPIEIYWGTLPELNRTYVTVLEYGVKGYTSESVSRLVDSLSFVGNRIGFDALIIDPPRRVSRLSSSSRPGGRQPDEVYVAAIKFTSNINYLHHIPKQEVIYKDTPDGTQVVLTRVSYNLTGEEVKLEGDSILYQLLHRYSLQKLWEQKAGWSFRWKNDSTLIRSKNTKRVYIHLQDKKPIEFYILEQQGNAKRTHISLMYNDKGSPVSKMVRTNHKTLLKETFLHDTLDRIIGKTVELPMQNEKFGVTYEYFKNEDLRSLVKIENDELITEYE